MSKAWSLIPFVLLVVACAREAPTASLQGYVEGDFVLLAAPSAGVLEKLNVQRGQQVAQGERVFELEHAAEDAAQREATQRVRSAQARTANLVASRRPPEIEASAAQAEQAKAARRLSELQL